MKNIFLLLAILFFCFLIDSNIYAQPCKEIVGYYPGWQWYDDGSVEMKYVIK